MNYVKSFYLLPSVGSQDLSYCLLPDLISFSMGGGIEDLVGVTGPAIPDEVNVSPKLMLGAWYDQAGWFNVDLKVSLNRLSGVVAWRTVKRDF